MQFKVLFIFLLLPLSSFSSCSKVEQTFPSQESEPKFSPPVDLGEIKKEAIGEASGLAASLKNAGSLWTHNDSGAEPVLFLINTKGENIASFYVDGATNRDWEDIAVGPGPEDGESYIYIGDIGDNNAVHETYKIYRIPEPKIETGSHQAVDTIKQAEVIEFMYPDGRRDAETLLLDPETRDLYIVSKRDDYEHIYSAAFPQSSSEVITLKKTGDLPIKIGGKLEQIVGGDISADGSEVLLKSYVQVFYWKRKNTGTSITELLQTEPVILPYMVEPQGEAIGFAADGSGYYTLSEKQSNITPHLYFYKRNEKNQ